MSRKRSGLVAARVTWAEQVDILRAAERAGQSVSAWLRDAGLARLNSDAAKELAK